MVSDNPVNGLTSEEYEFIAAVIEDENAELDLTDDGEYSLFTDWEGDGEFYPSVTILHTVDEDSQSMEEQKVNDLLESVSWFQYDETDRPENDHSNNNAHVYFYNPKIDPEVREYVEETL